MWYAQWSHRRAEETNPPAGRVADDGGGCRGSSLDESHQVATSRAEPGADRTHRAGRVTAVQQLDEPLAGLLAAFDDHLDPAVGEVGGAADQAQLEGPAAG